MYMKLKIKINNVYILINVFLFFKSVTKVAITEVEGTVSCYSYKLLIYINNLAHNHLQSQVYIAVDQ